MPFTDNIKLIKSIPVYDGIISIVSEDVPQGKTFVDSNGNISEGTVPVHDTPADIDLNAGDVSIIDAGLYREDFMVSAASLASQTSGTAVPEGIRNNETCWVNGVKVTGNMPINTAIQYKLPINGTYSIAKGYHDGNGEVIQEITTKAATTVQPAESDIVVDTINKYMTGNVTVKGVPLPDSNIVKKGEVYSIGESEVLGSCEGYFATTTSYRIELFNRGGKNSDYAYTFYESNTNDKIGFVTQDEFPAGDNNGTIATTWQCNDLTFTEKCICVQVLKTSIPVNVTPFSTINVYSKSIPIVQNDFTINSKIFVAVSDSNSNIGITQNEDGTFTTTVPCDVFEVDNNAIDASRALTASKTTRIDISSVSGDKYIHIGIISESINPSGLKNIPTIITTSTISEIYIDKSIIG